MVKEVVLTRGYVSLVDDEDYDRVMQKAWRVLGGNKQPHIRYAITGYALSRARQAEGRQNRNPAITMHRFIMECPAGMVVDHLNNNGLDNRRANLRICTHAENIARSNTANHPSATGYIGVYPHQEAATFYVRFRNRYIGAFRCPIEAARAYDHHARKDFGEHARVNFPL